MSAATMSVEQANVCTVMGLGVKGDSDDASAAGCVCRKCGSGACRWWREEVGESMRERRRNCQPVALCARCNHLPVQPCVQR